ncbi:hypothetical protein L484_018580 [Morus notabilis]|uniref:Uncharacterized protein n=1 Tax=Morus notabilis TaxID=981085 RepID=W9RHJ8_9ROSA|nr:hypothetical protein L484_018580 [Morus notabilis]
MSKLTQHPRAGKHSTRAPGSYLDLKLVGAPPRALVQGLVSCTIVRTSAPSARVRCSDRVHSNL